MDPEILDLDDCLERIQGDRELLLELVDIFLDDAPKKIQQAEQLLRQQSHDALSDVAHGLKGAAGNISAKKLQKIFLEIEEKAKQKTEWTALSLLLEQAKTAFDEFTSYIPALKKHLSQS
jgi:HPt (histidine-containing phosphotransfer) domain-containing protein